MDQENRRKNARIDKHFMVHYRPADAPGEAWRMSPLKDISRSGARFLCEGDYTIGQKLEVELHMPASPKPQKVSGTIVRVRQTQSVWIEIGIQFTATDVQAQEAIDSVIGHFLKRRK